MKKASASSAQNTPSSDLQKLTKYADEKVLRAKTAANVLSTKLSHEQGVVKDGHITGCVGGKAVKPSSDIDSEPGTDIKRKNGERALKPSGSPASGMGVPVSRKIRPISASGQSTFHIRHTSVTARDISKGHLAPAGVHDLYIIREAAVSVMAVSASINGAEQGLYIEREAALEPTETAPILSNISADAKVRQDFHEKMEASENSCCGETRGRSLKLNVKGEPEFYRKLLADPTLPAKITSAIENALAQLPQDGSDQAHLKGAKIGDKSSWVVVPDDEHFATRRALCAQGWRMNTKRWANTVCLDQGSSPQIYHRIEGEMPASLTVEQRAAALKEFCLVFAQYRLPYIAVLHSADVNNDPKNVHFHVIYYSRPASLMTGNRDNHMKAPTQKAILKAVANGTGELPKTAAQIRLQYRAWPYDAPLPEEFVGKWDFEVEVRYQKKKSGNWKVSRPFRQLKCHRVTQSDWFEHLRKRAAEAVNDQLVKAGLPASYHAGSFEDLEIDKVPEKKLFKDQSSREMQGKPTRTGAANEQSNWDYRVSLLEKSKQAGLVRLSKREQALTRRYHRSSHRTPELDKMFDAALLEYGKARIEAVQKNFEADSAKEHIARLKSRPFMIIKRQRALARCAETDIESYSDSPAKLVGARTRFANATKHIAEACAYVAELDYELGNHLSLPARSAKAAADAKIAAGEHLALLRQIQQGKIVLVPTTEEPLPSLAAKPQHQPARPQAIAEAPSDVARFVAHLITSQRRLVVDKAGRIAPEAYQSEQERSLVEDSKYLIHQNSLRQAKFRQDEAIADVVRRLLADPSALVLRAQGDGHGIPERYELQVMQASLKANFAWFGGGPEITAAAEVALKTQEEKRLAEERQKAEAIRLRILKEDAAREAEKLNRFVENIIYEKRRLTQYREWIIPVDANADELAYIKSSSTSSIKARLQPTKDAQDRQLDDLGRAIVKHPELLKPRENIDVDDLSLALNKRYLFSSSDLGLQAAFHDFGSDPVVIRYVADTLAAKRTEREEDLASEIIEIVAKHHLRPTVVTDQGTTMVTFEKNDQVSLELPETLKVSNPQAQQRIRRLIDKHDVAAKRLIAFVNEMPELVQDFSPGEAWGLAAEAPDEMQQIAINMCRDRQVLRAMRNAIFEALDKLPSPALSNHNSKVDSAQLRAHTKPAIVTNLQMNATTSKEVALALVKGAESAQEETQKFDLAAVQNGDARQASNARNLENDRKKNGPIATQMTEAEEQPVCYIDENGKLRFNYYDESPLDPAENDIGKAKYLGEDPVDKREAAEEARRRIEREKNARPMDAFDTFDFDAHTARARPKRPSRELVRGLNDKIDLWMDEDRKQDYGARCNAAGAIQRNPAARAIIEELEPKIRARFERDFEAFNEKARQLSHAYQQSLGREL